MWTWVESPHSGPGHPQRPDSEGYWEGKEWEIWEVQGHVTKNSSSSPWITKSLDCSDDNSDCHSLITCFVSGSVLSISYLALAVTL